MVQPLSTCRQAWSRRHCLEAQGLCLQLGALARRLKMKNSAAPAVKREEEEECGKRNGGNYRQEPDHDLGPTTDGTYIVEFRTAEGEALAISIR